ncbi:MAG: nitrate ABC transporter ATP-binding protein [Acidobacteria bacterium RIFCSPLOWO2_02_FULL_68_18]|nr:MAG: nitrate ABC transporter ATP-binding protein [Acidobacteria bacterium RIFCSPLOWO2_02_FULL_68_18]OFW49092.1 MAG: nitrate ABC transporter ATP-binding protein [Acidobacteria bacterium RIFCSPLOWO2_12_FULL_68_19]
MLRIRGLTIAYGGPPVLENVDLDVAEGEFVSLIGASGSGKTSVLRAVTTLLYPLGGTIDLAVPPTEVGFLFQEDALLPWRTTRENVSLGLRIRGMARPAAARTADEWLALLKLDGLGDRYPRQLSGGQRKRVALAQVLALEPRLLLMDEPFASLDAIVRVRITEELLGWVERKRLTVLLVTHDLEEAISLSDAVYVLSRGQRSTVQARRAVPIPRPRHVLDSRSDAAFGPLLQQLWQDLGEESPTQSAKDER